MIGDTRRPALRHHERALSRADLARLAHGFAADLSVLNAGSSVAIWIANGPELLALYLACFERNLVPMPLAPGLKWPELRRILDSAHPDALILAASEAHAHADLVVQLAVRTWAIAPEQQGLQPLHTQAHHDAGSNTFAAPIPCSDPEAPCLVLHTSGSTGHPKGVVLPRRAVQHILEYRLTHCELTSDSIAVVSSCLAQSVGLYQALALLAAGAQIVLLDSYELEPLVQAVNDHQPSHLILVVSAFDQLLHHPRISAQSLARLRFAAAGADRLTARVQQRFATLTGGVLRASYGLSESSWALVNDGTRADQALSLGKPCPDVTIELRSADGSPVSPGETGEIHIQSPRTMLGYLNDPQLTSQVLREGWLSTGDLAYQDADGYFWFAGRSKHLIVLPSGDNVSPTEVEDVLRTHPAVAACLVTSRETAAGAQAPWAFVVPSQAISPAVLRDFLKEHLSDFKVPAAIEFVTELPLGLSGKVIRPTT